VTSGTYNLVFNGNTTTGNLQYSATAAEVQAALNALPAVSNNVNVSGDFRNGFQVNFVNNLQSTNVSQLTINAGALAPAVTPIQATLRDGASPTVTASIYFTNALAGADVNDEVFSVVSGATSPAITRGTTAGVFSVVGTAGTIALGNANALGNGSMQIQTGTTLWATNADRNYGRLTALYNTALTLGGRREWGGTYDLAVSTMQLVGGTLGNMSTISVDDPAVEAKVGFANEVQAVNLLGLQSTSPTVGSWTLTFEGETTIALPWNASVVQVEQAINALPNFNAAGRAVSVIIGSQSWVYNVMFLGSYGQTDVPMMTASVVNNSSGPGTIPIPWISEVTKGARIGGSISETTGTLRALTKTGNGVLTMGGNNAYGGSTLIDMGIVRVLNDNPFGIGNSSTYVDLGSVVSGRYDANYQPAIEIDAQYTADNSITIANKVIRILVPSASGAATLFASGFQNNYKGMIRSISGDNTITGQIQLRSNAGGGNYVYVGVDSGTLTFGGDVVGIDRTGTGYVPGMGVAKTGAGTLVYGSSGSNGYTGSNVLIDGTWRLATGGQAINGGTFYIGDHTTGGSNRDVVQIASPEQIGDAVALPIGKTGKIEILPTVATQTTDEVTKVTLVPGTVSSGTWYLVFDPDGAGDQPAQTTWALPYNATAQQVEAALNALSAVTNGGGFVNVSGTLAKTNEVQMMVYQNAAVPTSAGTYTLEFDPDGAGPAPLATTAAIDWSSTAATVQTRLQALSNVGTNGVQVSGAYNTGFVLTYGGLLAGRDISDTALTFKIVGTSMTSTPTIATATQGGLTTGYNTTQMIYLGNTAGAGGTYTLTYNNATTASIAATADAATVRASLEALATIGSGNVQVVGRYDGGFMVTFVGSMQGMNANVYGTINSNVAALTAARTNNVTNVMRIGGLDTGTKVLTTVARSSTTVTATLANHGFYTGQQVWISGANQADYNGLYTITVNDANTFTYISAGTGATPATGQIYVQSQFASAPPTDNYYIMFRGALGDQDIQTSGTPTTSPYLSAATNLLGGVTPTVNFTEMTKGGQAVPNASNETQTVTLTPAATGVQTTLSFRGYNTPLFNTNMATPAQIEAALNALPSIGDVGGYVRVSSAPALTSPFTAVYYVTFLGSLGGQDLPMIIPSLGTTAELVRGGLTSSETVAAITANTGDNVSTDISVATGANLVLNGTATYNVFPASDGNATGAPSATISGGGNLALLSPLATVAGTRTITLHDGPATDDLVITAHVTDSLNGLMANFDRQGNGPGRVVVDASSTYTGTTTLQTGITRAEDNDALGSLKTNESVRITQLIPDEVQTITFSPTNPASGTYLLTFNGWTTMPLAYSATAATVQSALEALPSIGSGNINVTGTYTTSFIASFVNARADNDWPLIVPTYSQLPSTISVSETTKGGAGTWTISFNGFTTSELSFNATSAEVAAAMNALPSVALLGGTVRAYGYRVNTTQSAYVLTFMGGALGGFNWADTLVSTSPVSTINNLVQGGTRNNTTVSSGFTLELGGGITITNEPLVVSGVGRLSVPVTYVGATVTGTGAVRATSGDNTLQARADDEQQVIEFTNPAPASGTWTVAFNGQTTSALSNTATAADVKAALGALSSVGNPANVNVTGDMATGFTVTFVGARTRTAYGLMSVVSNTLDSTSIVIGEVTAGSPGTAALFTFGGNTTLSANAGAKLTIAESIDGSVAANVYNALIKVGDGVVEMASPSGANTSPAAALNVSFIGNGQTFVNDGTLLLNKAVTLTNEVQLLSALGKTDEQQRITFSVTNPTAGTFTLAFNGQTTAAIAYNANAAQVQAALAALPSIGSVANVDVQGTVAAGFTVTFMGTVGNVNWDNMVVVVNALSSGAPSVAEYAAGGQTATGTYVLTFAGVTTYPLAWNATPAQVQNALTSLASVGAGNVVVSGTPGGDMYLSFQNFFGNADMNAFAATVYQNSSSLAYPVNTLELIKGVGDEIQNVSMNANPTGGYYILTFNSQPSAPIPFDADAATVQAALEGIAGIGAGNVRVMGGPMTGISPLIVRFVNGLGQTDVNTLGGVSAMLSGTTIAGGELAKGGYTALSQAVTSNTVFVGDVRGGAGTLQWGPNSTNNAIPDGQTVHVLPNGVLDLATNSKFERISQLWLGVGGTTSAQVMTGTGTLALNPTGDTTGYFTYTFVDGGTTWAPATISGNLDLASPQTPRTRRWFKVMGGPAEVELDVSANLIGAGGVEKSGQGTMKLRGNNTYVGETVVNEGVLLVASGTALGSAAFGTTVEWGAAIGFTGNIGSSLAEPLTLASAGVTCVTPTGEVYRPALFNLSGNNTFAGPITMNYTTTIESLDAAGTLTLTGDILLNAALTVDGVGKTVINGNISSSSLDWQAGLLEGRFTGGTSGVSAVFDETYPNTGTGGVKLTPAAGETGSLNVWWDYTGYVYSGQFYDADGIFTFAESIDDYVEVDIDGVTRLRNLAAGTASSTASIGAYDNLYANPNGSINYGMGPNGDGWHDIEIRFYNTTGVGGAVGSNLWSTFKGFGLDPNNINTAVPVMGNYYQIPADPGDMTLFRTKLSTGNTLTKTGSGTLTLGGSNNTYAGETRVEQGSLLVNGNSGMGVITILPGATLGGNGGTVRAPIALQSGASINPGSGGTTTGILSIATDLTLVPGSNYTVDLRGTVAGTSHDQLAETATINLNGATLNLVVDYVPSDLDRYVLINNAGTAPVGGTFAGLANHAIVNVGGENFRIFYDGGDGNDVVLVKTGTLAVSTIRYDAGANDLATGDPLRGIYGERSVISRIVVTFNGYIDAMDSSGAFKVDRMLSLADARAMNVNYELQSTLVGESSQVIVTFTGGDSYVSTYSRAGTQSLNDGNYKLTIDASKITSNAEDMTADKVDDFYRWFGDSDMDRDTDGTDMFNIRQVLTNNPSYNQYKAGFDYDGDNDVDATDYNMYFKTRYGRRLLPPT
jgi:autotransporter-associated beta strand protein